MTDKSNSRKRVSLACEQCRAKRTRVRLRQSCFASRAAGADADADNSVTEDSPNAAHVCRRNVPASTRRVKISASTSSLSLLRIDCEVFLTPIDRPANAMWSRCRPISLCWRGSLSNSGKRSRAWKQGSKTSLQLVVSTVPLRVTS